ncbi:hypothetical protein WMY93_028393 [Mugilogobius chulae]|uniref:PiggyBac transposable element-derived protein domain-containing protein n=1 Tax=Mugilogobius chulae TaxID=88201 RepID=A0AAW0MZ68_9GOBI
MKDMRNWTNITVKDFYIHLATILYTSLVKLSEETDYWKERFPYGLSFPGKIWSRHQFQRIKRALSLCDPEKDEENESKKDTPEYDKLFKIKPFFNEMVNACKSHFQPHSNICINERNVTKNQPLTCGFALFALADSQTGYTWNLHIYTGKTAETRKQSVAQTASKSFQRASRKNIGCCGILNKHHPEFPKTSQNDFPSPASRGDIRWIRKDRLLFVKWIDTREISMCSTVHEAFTGQVMKRPAHDRPDKNGPLQSYGLVPHKRVSARWHTALFYYLLDLAVVNSFILYKELAKLKDNTALRYVTEKQFREDLCRELLRFGTGADPDAPAEPSEPSEPAFGCFPSYYNETNATNGRRTCRQCHKHTPIYCEKCEVPLCLVCNRNCFKKWHMEKKDKQKSREESTHTCGPPLLREEQREKYSSLWTAFTERRAEGKPLLRESREESTHPCGQPLLREEQRGKYSSLWTAFTERRAEGKVLIPVDHLYSYLTKSRENIYSGPFN